MSKIERYQGNLQAFASNAQGLERTVFGGTEQANDLTSQVTAAFLRGWGIVGPSEYPSLEDFNAAMFAMSQFLAYQHQAGIPEWHAEQEYYTGSVCTHDGVSYQSLGDDNVGNEPPSAQWTAVITAGNGGEFFQPKNAKLTAFSGLAGAANRLPYFTGANALALTALTAAGRDLIGKADVAEMQDYLGVGLSKYGSPLIGELVEWPRSEMPQEIWPDCGMEFIPYMGQSFDAEKYPLLAQLHPTNVLPADMRAYVPRGWDNARGIDTGRVLMSSQGDAIREISGELSDVYGGGLITPSGGFSDTIQASRGNYYTTSSSGAVRAIANIKFSASASGVPIASENRVKTVAWNMIVRAK